MKLFDPFRDIKEQVSEINELNIYDGAIFSGAVVGTVESANIKTFNHWQSGSRSGSYYHACYSTHITSSAAVELFDITFGFSNSSSYYSDTTATNVNEKNKIYRLFAKKLLGSENERFEISGTIRDELIFLALNRSQHKDELKKETISIRMINSGSGGSAGVVAVFDETVYRDEGAINSYVQDEIAGDYAFLRSGSNVGGLVFYKAGILALIPEVVSNTSSVTTNPSNTWSGSLDYPAIVTHGGTGSFDNTLDGIRYRFRNLSIINQTNLHSTFYFCRALNDEFNYSSNPTFIDGDKRIIPTSGSNNMITRTYITKVGLMGDNDEILAVASLSRPLKNGPDSELVVKVRLDY